MLRRFPHYRQYDEMDCGPTCLRIVCKYYGKSFTLERLRDLCHTTRAGATLLGISEAAEKLGFRTIGARLSFDDLREEAPFPCMAYWNQRHFVIVYKMKKDKVFVSDPAHGLLTYPRKEFLKGWAQGGEEGIILT